MVLQVCFMKLKFILLGGMALMVISILVFTAFDFSETIPIVNVHLEVVVFENEPVVIDHSVEQSQTTKLRNSHTMLQSFPAIGSHALVEKSYFSNWGIVEYNGTGQYDVQIGFEEGAYPKSNENITVYTYIYSDEGKIVLKEASSFIWN